MEKRNEEPITDPYTEGFNRGYVIRQYEPELMKTLLDGLQGESDYTNGLKDGAAQYEMDLTQEKGKDIIPPFDMDNIDSSHIDLDTPDKSPDKDRDKSK